MQIFETKKVGRPRLFEAARYTRVEVRFSQEELRQIDAYQPHGKKMSRSAAVRALVLQALAQENLCKDVNITP